MNNDTKKDQLIQNGYRVFANSKKPKIHIKPSDGFEEEDFNAMLEGVDLHSLGKSELGHPGWSPIGSASEESLCYFMPKLVEIALNLETNDEEDLFLPQFLWILTPTQNSNRFKNYSVQQIGFIIDVLQFIEADLNEVIQRECIEDDLEHAKVFWKKFQKEKT